MYAERDDDDTSIVEDLKASGISDHAAVSLTNSSFLQSLEENVHKDDMDEEVGENKIRTEKTEARSRKQHTESLRGDKDAFAKAKTSVGLLADKGREGGLARALHAYLQVCLSRGMMARAYHTLMYHRRNGIRNPNATRVLDVALYNLLLRTYADNIALRSNFGKSMVRAIFYG